ncbi:MAG: mevalonate kinase [Bradymonadaceae bacterium]
MTAASAPGKLFLFGEYAVLGGGWAIVTAVDRRVRASFRPDGGGPYRARGLDTDETELVDAVARAVGERTGTVPEVGAFRSDVREVFEEDRKLGLGSSAASSVALTAAALARLTDSPDRSDLLAVAESAHRTFQDGIGSGAGLAAAAFGGTLAVRRRSALPPYDCFEPVEPADPPPGTRESSADGFSVHRFSLPDEFDLRPVWLGDPASTLELAGSVASALDAGRTEPREVLRTISAGAANALRACREGRTDSLLDAMRRADRAMESLGRASETEIAVERHRRLRRIAGEFDLVAKPSGAGGGDFSLLAGRRPVDWKRVAREIPEGAELFDLDLGVEGVRPEHGSESTSTGR